MVSRRLQATNLIDKEYLRQESDLFLRHLSPVTLQAQQRIGLFLGGNTRGSHLDENYIHCVIDRLKEAAEEINAEILKWLGGER